VSLVGLFDTHCHLDFDDFEADRNMVLERAKKAGVQKVLNPGSDILSSQAAIRLSKEYDCVYVAIGVHPNLALTWDETSINKLQLLAKEPRVKAIGEIGLDFFRQHALHETQKTVFQKQLNLAAELGLPVIIHSRMATRDVLDLLSPWWADLKNSHSALVERPGVFHSYTDDPDLAIEAVKMNFFVGITGPVTYKNADDVRRVVETVPLESLVVETDAPYLPPLPHRGKRNEPAFVALTAQKIAELKKVSVEHVAEATTSNAIKLFGLETVN